MILSSLQPEVGRFVCPLSPQSGLVYEKTLGFSIYRHYPEANLIAQ